MAERVYDRSSYSEGSARQMAAVMASGSRHEALQRLAVPALVIHGDADPLIDVACGRDTAACIPGARYLEIKGLGHSLPRPAWDPIMAAIDELTGKSRPAPGVSHGAKLNE
jgi:pimeloyl-ACP methyl ester carboxylesterase